MDDTAPSSLSPAPSKNEIRGKKRPLEITITQQFMEENYPDEIGESRQYFLHTEDDSSIDKKSGNEHIIYFQPFLNYDLVITNIPKSAGKFFQIVIKPVEWAHAFNQLSLDMTAQALYSAIMTSECLLQINLDLIGTTNISEIIQRASVWMMAKFDTPTDPWSFPLNFGTILTKISEPNPDDKAAIIATLQKMDPFQKVDAVAPLLDVIADRTNFDNAHNVTEEFREYINNGIQEENKYSEMFRKCVDKIQHSDQRGMNTAQIGAALTKSTIPQNRDQIVSMVQFQTEPGPRWKKAFQACKTSIGLGAAKLSSTIVRRDFGDRQGDFTSAGDICPVKLLAIRQGAKFLHARKDVKNGFQEIFDSAKPHHNLYPTREECIQIDKELYIRGKATLAALNAAREVAAKAGENLPMEIQKLLLAPLSDVTHQGDHGNQNVTSSTHIPLNDQYNSFPAVNTLGGNDQENFLGLLEIPENTSHFFTTILEKRPSVTDDSKNLSLVEIPLDKEILKRSLQDPTGNLTAFEPKLLRDDFTDTHAMLLTVQNIEGNVTSRTYAFSRETWTSAMARCADQGPIAAGKKDLIPNLFETEELKNCTPSGKKPGQGKRRPEWVLNEARQQMVLDAVRYFVGNVALKNCKYVVEPWSPSVEAGMRNKIITSGSNEIRASLLNSSGQNLLVNDGA